MSDTNNETTATGGEDLASIVADLRAQLTKVNSKNRELISEKQAAKQAAEDAETVAAENSGNLEALKSSHARAMQKMQDKMDAQVATLRTIRVDNAIKDALQAGNVNGPVMAKALTAMLKDMAVYENDEASIEGRPIGDFVRDYLSGDEGKFFVRASSNSGGGAQGSDGSKGDTAFSEGEYMRRFRENPTEAKSWAVRTGNAWITQS